MLEARDALDGDETRDRDSVVRRTVRTDDLLFVLQPAHAVQARLVTEVALTASATEVLAVPPSHAEPQALVVNGLLTFAAQIGLLVGKIHDARRVVGGNPGGGGGVEIAEIIEEDAEPIIALLLSFELERPLQTDADEKLQVVCEAGHKR